MRAEKEETQVDQRLNPWDQQPGEPDRWYGRFQVYLAMGPTRTLIGVYRQLSKAGQDGALKLSGRWDGTCRHWRWRERARAWDARQRDLLALSQYNVRLALHERRVEVMEDYLERVRLVLDNAKMEDADQAQARAWLPQMRAFLRDLLVAERQEFERLALEKNDPDREPVITADDLLAAQRELEARRGREAPLEIARPPAGDKRQLQRTILVCAGADDGLKLDLAALRAVRSATGLGFSRVLDATRSKFAQALRRERNLGRPVELVHLALHASAEGVLFGDGLADANWLSERLAGVRIMLVAGCEGDVVGGWLGVVPHVITLSEEIGSEDAAMLTQHFWHNVGLGKEPGAALDEALAHCAPVVGEYVVRHW